MNSADGAVSESAPPSSTLPPELPAEAKAEGSFPKNLKPKLQELSGKAQALVDTQLTRVKKELATFEEAARATFQKRIENTKAEKLLQTVPSRAVDELDVLLDRVGLLRKAKHHALLEQLGHGVAAAEAEKAEAEPSAKSPSSKKKHNKARASA
jgi:hypothetical protein